ncbi:MAG: hypothetical protein NZ922_03610 [Candidatus Methanomethyliaceae archaeon]|nr:hypothetical protein [Candidatus Methanomethyliaceae archaeon]MDW7970684.1 16S rRNA methyltransferase [Nitrososphaerota archaeon]
MKKVNVVLARSALELIPKEIVSHSVIKNWAERRKKDAEKMLLDISYHYAAMKNLRDWDRRGRPDIVHITLLNLLGSPLNREGFLQVFVHTVNDFTITIDPVTNIPRNYLRFVGLMEQLFEIGRVPPKGKWLMRMERKNLKELIEEIKPSKTIILTEKGKKLQIDELGNRIIQEENPLIIIGGFQRGEFSNEDFKLANEIFSIYKKPLDAWIVASMIVCEIGRLLKIV